jgi:hypothetical protein
MTPITVLTLPSGASDSVTYGPKTTSVRVKALDGTWETLGVDRARGVTPESITTTTDTWGPASAAFTLHRDGRLPAPDLAAYTPVEIEVGGKVVWDGRIIETPTRTGAEDVISVQCQGWQYHLDDDMYERVYVHDHLSAWQDARSIPEANLSFYTTGFGVNNSDNGSVTLSLPTGATAGNFGATALHLDLGSSSARRVVIRYESGGSASGWELTVKGSDVPLAGGDVTVIDNGTLDVGPAQWGADFTAPRRYIEVRLQNMSGGTITGGDTQWVRILALRAFAIAGYEQSGFSNLKASDVVNDALASGTVLLSADRSRVTATSFNIPELAPTEPRTPREYWDGVDAYHGFRKQIRVGRVPVYEPLPAAPLIEVGDVEFEDASANNGQDVYDRVMVAWQSPSGQQLRVTRTNATALTLRQGFHRTFQLSVSSALPSDGVAASQIGDVWLANHRSVPFRGTVRIVGDSRRGM